MKKTKSIFVFLSIASSLLFSHPQEMSIVSGFASKELIDNTLKIYANDKTIINWSDFSIGPQEIVQFIQPSSSAAVLNRVIGKLCSNILGSLEGTGKIYLINPNGIFIGKEALINTSAFIASTFDVLDNLFLKEEDFIFSGESKEKIINLGKISASDGDVILIARQIENKGSALSEKGVVAIGAGKEILLKPKDKQRIFIKPAFDSQIEGEIGIDNQGEIKASSTFLKSDGYLYSLAINSQGTIEAFSIEEKEGGEVYLLADRGSISVSGKISAREKDIGGRVELLGKNVGITDQGWIDVSGKTKGGSVYLGRLAEEKKIFETNSVYVGEKGKIDADCFENGNGGRVILYSDNISSFYGNISASGGNFSGSGGFVEISGKDLAFEGRVNLSSKNGSVGTLLFDPYNITISTSYSRLMSFDEAKYLSTGSNAILNNLTLQSALSSADIQINTSSSGGQEGNINVNAPLTLYGNLTLIADNDINLNRAIKIDPQNGKDLICRAKGQINVTDNINCKNLNFISSGNINLFQDHQIVPVLKTTEGKIYLDGNNVIIEGSSGTEISRIESMSGHLSIITHIKNNNELYDGDFVFTGDGAGSGVILSGNSSFSASLERDFLIAGQSVIKVSDDTEIPQVQMEIKCRDLSIIGGEGETSSGIVVEKGNKCLIDIDASRNIMIRGNDFSKSAAVILSKPECQNTLVKLKASDSLLIEGKGDISSSIQVLDKDHSGTIILHDISKVNISGGSGIGDGFISSQGGLQGSNIGSINLFVAEGHSSSASLFSFKDMNISSVEEINLLNKGTHEVSIKTTNKANIYLNSKSYFGRGGVSINKNGGIGPAYITTEAGGDIECYFKGSSSLFSGISSTSDGGIFTAYSSGSGNIKFYSGDLEIRGGKDINSFGGIRAGYSPIALEGDVEFNVKNLTIIGGNRGYAVIGARGSILNSRSHSLYLEGNQGKAYLAAEKNLFMDHVGPLTMIAKDLADVSISTISSTGKEIQLLGLDSISMIPKGNNVYIRTENGGNITLNSEDFPGSGGMIFNLEKAENGSYIATDRGGNISCSFLGNSCFNGGSALVAESGIITGKITGGGDIYLKCNDLSIWGGDGDGISRSGIFSGYSSGSFSGGGDIVLNTNNLSLTGGKGQSSINSKNAEILAGSSFGSIDILSKGRIDLIGGFSEGSCSYIRTKSEGSFSNINILCDSMNLTSGNIINSEAAISTSENSKVDIVVAKEDLYLVANKAPSYIKHLSNLDVKRDLHIKTQRGADQAYIQTFAHGDSLKIKVGNDLIMISEGQAIFFRGKDNLLTDLQINVGNDFLMSAISSPITIEGYNCYDLKIGRKMKIKAGEEENSFASISGLKDITLSAGSLSLLGGNGKGSSVSISSEEGNIGVDVLYSSLSFTSGSGLDSDAYLKVNDNRDLSLNVKGSLVLHSKDHSKAYIRGGTFSLFNVGQELLLYGKYTDFQKKCNSYISKKGQGDFLISAGYGISLYGSEIVNEGGALTLISGTDLVLSDSSRIQNLSDLDLTCVVDNNYPSLASLGHGRIFQTADSNIQTKAGRVRLFTSKRDFNTILGAINGESFLPSVQYVDSSSEKWGSVYPNDFFRGSFFTIFYKDTFTISKTFLDIPSLAGAELFYRLNEMKTDLIILDYMQKYILRRKSFTLSHLAKKKESCHEIKNEKQLNIYLLH